MPRDTKELKEKLMQLINEAVSNDEKLRAELNIGNKFRFIKDRLQQLKTQIEASLQTIKVETEEKREELSEDEQLVYVYLFNAHGIDMQSWMKLVHPTVFYDHSVNRPIYGNKDHIEAVIRSKANRTQHGYLTVAIKKNDILKKDDAAPKDNLGHPLLKIKEGSLHQTRMLNLSHNGNTFVLDENGSLVKTS
ncbi:MAG TPA: type IVB secretion system protein IcmQ [Gammaproteobacteria bacterium]|jgi:hypothetical protein|nr:type IVB secretion system protein IcmQ [Gammaproteobacteria bacterium]